MRSSIVNLENVKLEVERRQVEIHAKGMSFVAIDEKKMAIVEYLPNGVSEIIGKCDLYGDARSGKPKNPGNPKSNFGKQVANY